MNTAQEELNRQFIKKFAEAANRPEMQPSQNFTVSVVARLQAQAQSIPVLKAPAWSASLGLGTVWVKFFVGILIVVTTGVLIYVRLSTPRVADQDLRNLPSTKVIDPAQILPGLRVVVDGGAKGSLETKEFYANEPLAVEVLISHRLSGAALLDVELPTEIKFYSAKHPEVAEPRSLRVLLDWSNNPGEAQVPLVIRGTKSGVFVLGLVLMDAKGDVMRVDRTRIRFVSRKEK